MYGPFPKKTKIEKEVVGLRVKSPVNISAPPRFPSKRMLVEWWSVLLIATLGIIASGHLFPPERASHFLYDMAMRATPPAPAEDLLIVSIDNHSLNELGSWPWSRATHARLIDQLTNAGVSAIGYDIAFSEPQSREEDEILAEAIARNGRVVLPALIDVPGPNGAPARYVPPIPAISSAAAGVGHVAVQPDMDGIVRGVSRLSQIDGQRYYHFAEKLVALTTGQSDILQTKPSNTLAPIISGPRDLIPFVGPAGTFPQVSFVDVVTGQVPAEMLEGKIVLVGATATGMGERFSTPTSGARQTMPGVELNAHYANALLQERLVREAPVNSWQIFALVPMWLLMLSLLFMEPRENLYLGLALVITMFVISYAALAFGQIWLTPALGIITVGIIFPIWGWRRLDLTSRYLVAELAELSKEQTVLPRRQRQLSGDQVERHIALMHQAIRDIRDLRQFVWQSLDSLPDAAVITDLDGNVLIANDAAEALFVARLGSQLTSRPLEDLFRVLDNDPQVRDPRALELLHQIEVMDLSEDASEIGYETQLVDGTCLAIRLVFFTDANGKPLGWIVRFADVTSMRASEKQREDALRLLTHDMRAPQAAILAVLEGEKNIPEETARRIERYAQQTITLADDFVHLARAESGRFMLETFNISDAVWDAADDLWPLANAKNIRIETELPEDEALVMADRGLLTRAITNIMSNALKYSPENTCVRAKIAISETHIFCDITDQGRGIPQKDLANLFDAFTRVAAPQNTPVSANASGAGLGLAFVKAVIERHFGRLTVESEVGVGSTFGFVLPRAHW